MIPYLFRVLKLTCSIILDIRRNVIFFLVHGTQKKAVTMDPNEHDELLQ